jgi:hypothetical protein
MKKLFIKILGSLILYITLCTGQVSAGFGISPGLIYNDHLKPGMHYEQEIYISRSDAEEELTVLVEPDLAEIDSWFKFEPGKKFTFAKNKHMMSFKAIIDVPKEAEIKKYHGYIRVKATNSDSDKGGVSVVKGARMNVDLIATEINVVELNVQQLKLDETKQDNEGNAKLTLHVKAENTGNTAVSFDKITLDIQNIQQKPVTTLSNESQLPEIKPSEVKTFDVNFNTKISAGEYFAIVKIYFNNKVIKTERLVLRIIGNISVSETTSNTPQADKSIISRIKTQLRSNQVLGFSFLLIAAALTVGTTLIVLKKRWQYKNVVLILGIIAFVFAGIGIYLTFINNAQKQVKNEVPSSGSVQGDTTTKNQNGKIEKVKINKVPEEIKYYVYEKPDVNSSVIHVALEGENFTVIDENSQWYRIELLPNLDGWIQKNNIKKVE